MKRPITFVSRSRAILLSVCLGVLCSPADAQWIHHPTPDTPRLPDGKADLSAPAPRTPDGKPDLSGVWYSRDFCDLFCFSRKRSAEFLPAAQAIFDQRRANKLKDSPNARCLPPGLPNMEFDPHKIVQNRNELAILYGTRTMFREVFLDGRELPHDPNPSWMGYSVGRWEGDTLVVDVVGLTDRSWIAFADPHSELLKLTERFRRTNFGRIEMEITVDDPKTYVKPWTVKASLTLNPDTELLEDVCENEKDVQHLVGK
jgi:hypothetical protein